MILWRIIAIFTLAASSSQSLALIEGQVLMGQRSSSSGELDYKGTENKLSVYLDPIPLVPVGFGVTMAQATVTTEVLGAEVEQKQSETTLDVTAWLPMGIAGFKPYAKLGYVVAGKYESSTDVSGTKMAAGLRYSPLPLFGVMLELEKSAMKLGEASIDNMGILLGAYAGI